MPFLFVALALFAYFWGLSSTQIPKIGDEVLYQQIARVTAESGQWLPLRYEAGILSTKPPLLYWMGIISTGWARFYNLLSLRIPVVMITLAGAYLVYLLAKLRSKDTSLSSKEIHFQSLWAAALYLGFLSTFQHGRPFLVNSFEVLFLILPLYSYWKIKKWNLALWCICIFSWGAVAWAKSFALIGVGAFSLWAASIPYEKKVKRKLMDYLHATFSKKTIFFETAILLSLGIFALWFVFDPDPKLLFQQFVIGENAVKFKGYHTYFAGLFSGNYPVWRIWFGAFANAGLAFFLLIGLCVALWKKRKTLSLQEKSLLYATGAYLVFFTLPTQRQENYILPTMALWAILIAEWRGRIHPIAVRLTSLLLILAFGVLSLAPWILHVGKDFNFLHLLVFIGCLGAFLYLYSRCDRLKVIPLLIFLIYIQLANLFEPFSTPFEFFQKDTAQRQLFVPSRKLSQHERFRFRAPGSEPSPYEATALKSFCENVKPGSLAILESDLAADCSHPFEVLESRRDFKTRQSFSEILKIAGGEDQYLIRDLILVRFR